MLSTNSLYAIKQAVVDQWTNNQCSSWLVDQWPVLQSISGRHSDLLNLTHSTISGWVHTRLNIPLSSHRSIRIQVSNIFIVVLLLATSVYTLSIPRDSLVSTQFSIIYYLQSEHFASTCHNNIQFGSHKHPNISSLNRLSDLLTSSGHLNLGFTYPNMLNILP